ncbi:hypothetical protein FQR65_LT01511 [Abscondita terminalis]|nr:hypothetical protein FQR65_LT01511 [Abscondita terminalis]
MKLFLLLPLIASSVHTNFIKNFSICERSDPNLNQCLKEAIQKALRDLQYGVTEYDIPTMEPLQLSELSIPPSPISPFIQNYKNLRIYNHASSTIKEIQAAITDNDLFIKILGFNPLFKVVSEYNFENAMMLGLNMTGNGTVTVLKHENSFELKINSSVINVGEETKLSDIIVEFSLYPTKIDITLDHHHIELKNFKICKRSDPNLNECLKNAIQMSLQYLQYGVPEFGIPTMEPLELPELIIPPSAITPFVQIYKNLRMYNHATSIINELHAVITDLYLFIKLRGFNPMFKTVNFYRFDNAIMGGVNMTGNGTLNAVLLENTFEMKINASATNDGRRSEFSDVAVDFSLYPTKIDVRLEHHHLELSNTLSEHTTNHSLLMFQEFQKEYSNIFGDIAVITDSQLFIIFSGFIPTLNIAGFYHFENALLDGINMTGNGTLTTTLNNNKFDMKINASAISDGSQTKFSEATIDFRLCPERMVFAIGRQHLELNNGLKQFSNNYSFLLFQEFRKNFKICKRSDPNLSECLKDAIQKSLQYLQYGVPEYGIPTMEPLEIPELSIPPSPIAPFVQNHKNVRIYNHSSSIINELQAVITDTHLLIKLKGFNPMFKSVSLYHFENAMMMGVNMSGKGTLIVMTLENTFDMEINAETIDGGNGKQRKLSGIRVDFKLFPTKLDINLDHQHIELNNELSDHVTNHGLALFEELREEYSSMFSDVYKNYMELLFSKLDFNDIFTN